MKTNEQILASNMAKSLSNYIKLMKTQGECTGFIDGYNQALDDFAVVEMLEMLKEIATSEYTAPNVVRRVSKLIKQATEI